MAILVEFIEKEKAFECHVDWRSAEEVKAANDGMESDPFGDESRDRHANAKKEMLAIYQWWTHDRKVEHDAYDKALEVAYPDGWLKFEPLNDGSDYSRLVSNPTPKEVRDNLFKMEQDIENKDEEMLLRLIKVREYMWT